MLQPNKEFLGSVRSFVESHIGDFHRKRLESLEKLKLDAVLKRKNPYLFRAKNVVTAADLVGQLVDAHLSSQEETLFGDFLERLAIHVNKLCFDGRKSGIEGIDIEFDRDGVRYLVAVKSGPNWGNSSQIKRMQTNFRAATKALKTSGARIPVQAVNGCCYGRNKSSDKEDYQKLCGQEFWAFISGSDTLYQDLIEPLGHEAKRRNEKFQEQYAARINTFTAEFIDRYCTKVGAINWPALVALGSEAYKK